METYLETDMDICEVGQDTQVIDQVWKFIFELAM